MDVNFSQVPSKIGLGILLMLTIGIIIHIDRFKICDR